MLEDSFVQKSRMMPHRECGEVLRLQDKGAALDMLDAISVGHVDLVFNALPS